MPEYAISIVPRQNFLAANSAENDGGDDASDVKPNRQETVPEKVKHLDPPHIRSWHFDKNPTDWSEFNKELEKLPDMGQTEHSVIATIFGTEGGSAVDTRNDASSGVVRNTFDAAKIRGRIPGLEDVENPEDMTMNQRAEVMRDYLDTVMHRVEGKGTALEKLDYETAAAVASTLYHKGATGGGEIVDVALKEVKPGVNLGDKAGMGPLTFKTIKDINDDPESKWKFIETLADKRQAVSLPREKEMIDFYRFRHRR